MPLEPVAGAARRAACNDIIATEQSRIFYGAFKAGNCDFSDALLGLSGRLTGLEWSNGNQAFQTGRGGGALLRLSGEWLNWQKVRC